MEKTGKMENPESIFDVDIKEYELEYLFIKENKEEYLEKASFYKRYSDLYLLFKLRQDEEKAAYYLNKLLR
jgi:hypothetical protein